MNVFTWRAGICGRVNSELSMSNRMRLRRFRLTLLYSRVRDSAKAGQRTCSAAARHASSEHALPRNSNPVACEAGRHWVCQQNAESGEATSPISPGFPCGTRSRHLLPEHVPCPGPLVELTVATPPRSWVADPTSRADMHCSSSLRVAVSAMPEDLHMHVRQLQPMGMSLGDCR